MKMPAADAVLFYLVTPEGEFLHQSVTGALTGNKTYAWQGTREQMRNALDEIPEAVRRRLKPKHVRTPTPARRA